MIPVGSFYKDAFSLRACVTGRLYAGKISVDEVSSLSSRRPSSFPGISPGGYGFLLLQVAAQEVPEKALPHLGGDVADWKDSLADLSDSGLTAAFPQSYLRSYTYSDGTVNWPLLGGQAGRREPLQNLHAGIVRREIGAEGPDSPLPQDGAGLGEFLAAAGDADAVLLQEGFVDQVSTALRRTP